MQGVIVVWNKNLYGTEPNIDHEFAGGKLKLNYLPTVNVLEIRNQNLSGSESNIDCLYVPRPCGEIMYGANNMITRVGGHNLYGPELSMGNIFEQNYLNTRVRDQIMSDPESSVRNSSEGSSLRPAPMPGNPLPVLSNDLNF